MYKHFKKYKNAKYKSTTNAKIYQKPKKVPITEKN